LLQVLNPSISDAKLTIGEALSRLRLTNPAKSSELYAALHTSPGTYLKVERGERELSFLMALRLCKFYRLDLHEFISMLSDAELERQDYSVIRVQLQRARKKAEVLEAKVIDITMQKR
jgi:hypothetical protein